MNWRCGILEFALEIQRDALGGEPDILKSKILRDQPAPTRSAELNRTDNHRIPNPQASAARPAASSSNRRPASLPRRYSRQAESRGRTSSSQKSSLSWMDS